MESVLAVTTALGAVGAVVLGLLWWRARTDAASAHAEADQLRSLVKKRVERPNVFSHEVRTPLTLIKGAAELLAEETPGALNEQQREFVATINVNAQQVISLAQDLLAEARIDAQLFELRPEALDIRALVQRTVRDARRLHPTTIRLENQGGPLTLMADRSLLTQALWNLVNNACRHAGQGATVTVSVTRGENEVVVAVADDGDGISEAERERIFEPFALAGSEHSGTGLGLSITGRIIAQHGGRLLVDTLPGRGTTMFLCLPTAREGDSDG